MWIGALRGKMLSEEGDGQITEVKRQRLVNLEGYKVNSRKT